METVFRRTFVLTAGVYVALILSGYIIIDRGDAAQRTLISFDWAHHWWVHFNWRSMVGAIWLPGQFILQALIITPLLWLHISALSVYLWAVQLLQLALGLAGVAALARAFGPMVGITLLWLPALALQYGSGLTEIITFCFIALGICAIKENRIPWATLWFFAASTIRVEASVLTMATMLYLLAQFRWRDTLILAPALIYFAAKIVYAYLVPVDNFVSHNLAHYSLNSTVREATSVLFRLCWQACKQSGWALLPLLFLVHKRRFDAYLAVLSLSFAAYVVAAVYTREMTNHTRYMMFMEVFVAIALASGTVRYPRVAAALVMGIGAITTLRALPTMPPGIRDTIAWLNAHNANRIEVDFVDFWEQPIILYTLNPLVPADSWYYSGPPSVKRKFPPGLKDDGDRLTVGAHWYLADYKPDYVVLASDANYQEFRKQKSEAHHLRPSYLREWLVNGCLQSPYMPERPCLRPVFSTPDLIVMDARLTFDLPPAQIPAPN